jgi:hypothetical protein
MKNFNIGNYKLPHMSPFPVKKIVKKVEKPFDRTPKRLDIPEPIPIRNNGVVSSSGGNDLDEFLKRVESRKIKNPEYADVEGPEYSKSYDFFITNRNEESDKVARQIDSLNKVVMEQAKNRQFDEMKKTRAYQQDLMSKYDID